MTSEVCMEAAKNLQTPVQLTGVQGAAIPWTVRTSENLIVQLTSYVARIVFHRHISRYLKL